MRLSTALSAVALSIAALSAAPRSRADEPVPLTVEAGQVVNVCKAGIVVCPVSTFLCDDPKVARVENGPEGAVLKGGSPGTTLCSVLGFARATRRVLRVTVLAPDASPGR